MGAGDQDGYPLPPQKIISCMLQVGITGGIGSGKSVVAKIFNALGVPVYNADSHAKDLMTTDGNLAQAIQQEFGSLSYTSGGVPDRKYLAAAVFGHPDQLKKLNALVHPRVAEDYRKWLSQQQSRYVIKEAALLLDSGVTPLPDQIIVVTAPKHLRKERVMARDQRSEKEIDDIMERQLSTEVMESRANHVVVNDGIRPLIPQILELHKNFLAIAR